MIPRYLPYQLFEAEQLLLTSRSHEEHLEAEQRVRTLKLLRYSDQHPYTDRRI